VQRLGGLPLALATAGSFFRQHPTSVSEYLQRYESTWRIVRRPPRGLPEYQGRTLYTTWDMSFRQVQRQCQEAADLLKFLGYLDHQQIWYELLATSHDENSPAWFQKVTADKFAFSEAMGILVDLCLVEVHHETDTYSMHICVHDWVVEELNSVVEDTHYALALDCVARAIGYPDSNFDYESWHYGYFVPHALRLAHEKFRELTTQEISMDERSPKLNLVARLLDEQRLSKVAERMLTTLMTAQHTRRGFDHRCIFETAYNLGIVYDRQGKYTECQELVARAVARMELTVGPDHPETLLALDTLGVSYMRQGKSVQAEKVYTRALHLRKEHRVFDSAKILWTMRGLAASYAAQGKELKAKELFTRTLSGYKRLTAMEYESERGILTLAGYMRTSLECFRLLNVTWNQSRLPIAEVLSLLQLNTSGYDRESLSNASQSLFYWLGRCFLAAGDVANAQITFQPKFGVRDGKPYWQALARCDGCQRTIDAESGFNVCQHCPEFDLCDTCYAQYKSSQLSTGVCIDHPFFRVDTKNIRYLSDDEWNQWLQQVIQVYSPTHLSAEGQTQLEEHMQLQEHMQLEDQDP
jgi:tetratricopeptide (TPR) repeat protein